MLVGSSLQDGFDVQTFEDLKFLKTEANWRILEDQAEDTGEFVDTSMCVCQLVSVCIRVDIVITY
jgi:hypothetical protein